MKFKKFKVVKNKFDEKNKIFSKKIFVLKLFLQPLFQSAQHFYEKRVRIREAQKHGTDP